MDVKFRSGAFMDIQRRDALLAKVGDLLEHGNNSVWVEIEEFFDGNDDLASFWCNLPEPPEEMSMAAKFLRSIRSRNDVVGLRVCVTQFDGGDDQWPFSDKVLVISDAAETDVQTWFERFPPDEVMPVEDQKLLSDLGYRDKTGTILWWD